MSFKGKITIKRIYNHFFRSEKAIQATLYAKIKAHDYFDEDWYHLAYKDEIEFPDDLLADYVRVGIQKGRDPSPYFNTILYRREHDVPPERALLHFLRSRKPIASGAYRDEQALLNAQQAFRERSETALVADQRISRRPFAVFLQCGAGAIWGDWQPSGDQTWDLLVNHYDPSYAGKIPCEVELRQTGTYPGTKFTAFHSLLEDYPQLIEPYEYILLLDDDILFQDNDITRLFSIIQQHGWEMAQASLSVDSDCSFPIFINPSRTGWRRVNGVELMMPVYSRHILGTVRELIGQSISGWGYDPGLSVLAARQGFSAAVVDDIIARHTKPINADIGQYYQMLHRAQIYPEIEFTHLQKKYGFTKPLYHEV